MMHREQLIMMLNHAGIEWSLFNPDASDREGMEDWANSIVFSSDRPDGSTLTAFDFDETGNLLYASSFPDPVQGVGSNNVN